MQNVWYGRDAPNLFPRPPAWTQHVAATPSFARELLVALPCIGIDGACHAMGLLGIPFRAVHVYDIVGHVRHPLSKLHGEHRVTTLVTKHSAHWLHWSKCDGSH